MRTMVVALEHSAGPPRVENIPLDFTSLYLIKDCGGKQYFAHTLSFEQLSSAVYKHLKSKTKYQHLKGRARKIVSSKTTVLNS